MNTGAIRDRLYDYIRVADDKKIRAIYTMLEDSITEEVKWWNDIALWMNFKKGMMTGIPEKKRAINI